MTNSNNRPIVIERQAVRAILLTPDDEILLMRILPPDRSAAFWIAPGGGREAGECNESCLKRELMEELGLATFTVGPLVWKRQHTFNWGNKRFCQSEDFHVVRVNRFEPVMNDLIESKSLDRFQWWRADKLEEAKERLTPLSLAAIVTRFLMDGPPQGPLSTEILVD